MPALDSRTASQMARRSIQTRRLNALERRLRELVESGPDLSEEQRARLLGLLQASNGTAA